MIMLSNQLLPILGLAILFFLLLRTLTECLYLLSAIFINVWVHLPSLPPSTSSSAFIVFLFKNPIDPKPPLLFLELACNINFVTVLLD
ncbi:uncharacterized protein RHIMIDRAFT_69106 [Rhizopus microsporus ATCC 52813]|uniref:Uncharacterized protein n=1 Tax=Rhizopus microsporus ATCC 52813 TaxID=1340429 RepID=A0A2G4SKV6_RHIZD|nr:uncharacterized protein RHIMIDRAFT_69106 [Rhizopus microsporus ATCC 52813]PHZ09016.1 hypothetical protein RHIMIDRAFT_69106 [Rhizopus microsporus ATCC 52813]